MRRSEEGGRKGQRNANKGAVDPGKEPAVDGKAEARSWPFPAGSQNDTDKAVKLKPYVPPKRRTLNQY